MLVSYPTIELEYQIMIWNDVSLVFYKGKRRKLITNCSIFVVVVVRNSDCLEEYFDIDSESSIIVIFEGVFIVESTMLIILTFFLIELVSMCFEFVILSFFTVKFGHFRCEGNFKKEKIINWFIFHAYVRSIYLSAKLYNILTIFSKYFKFI